MTRFCAMCQADISSRDWRALYCSRYCREKAYRENNSERIKERKACDYQKRKVQVLAKNKEWYQANKSEISLRGKQARAAKRGLDLNDRCCADCGADIAHRTLKAEYCQSCSQTRERELKRNRAKEQYLVNQEQERSKRKEWYQQNKDEINLRGKLARAATMGLDLNDRRCTLCGDNISDRTLKAQYCQSCSPEREQELNRARANRAYAGDREVKKAQVQAYARTPRGRAKRREWEHENKEKMRDAKLRAHHQRRARKRGQQGKVSRGIVAFLLEKQGGRCAAPWCRTKISKKPSRGIRKFERDHIVPLAKGGLDDDSNLQLLCYGAYILRYTTTAAAGNGRGRGGHDDGRSNAGATSAWLT